jgi:hypothetical protein
MPTPTPPVNLFPAVPTVVAVSSAVANGAYLPEHLVDGKLDTAWNSRTGEGTASWVAVRVPATVHVTAILMTAGFTRANKREGDLFTGNPRISAVRVSRAGKLLVEQKLDPEVRTLQTIPLDAAGGDFKIEVKTLVPGTHATWRETCISELEIWGTLPDGQAAVPSAPRVLIGDLDALPAPAFADCQHTMFPRARGGRVGADDTTDWLTDWDELGVGRDLAICTIDHNGTGAAEITTDVTAVKKNGKTWTAIGAREQKVVRHADMVEPAGMSEGGEVTVEPYPLSASELGVQITTHTSSGGNMSSSDSKQIEIARVTSAGLVPILAWENKSSGGESSDSDSCTLDPFGASKKTVPAKVVLECAKTEGRYHGEDPRGNGEFSTPYKRRFKWDGAKYVELP